jgi:hypothetical protein
LPEHINFQIVKQVLVHECNGLVGTLRLSVDSLKETFRNESIFYNPTLNDLIKLAIGSMSSSVLKLSTVNEDFPKAATFQHLFMEGIAQYTTPICSICPELSKIFPDDSSGESYDFYLNSSLRWGIGLLINGNGITEHIDRFEERGKYSPLGLKDYAVVDFCGKFNGQNTRIVQHPKRISVFFKLDDFSSCKCIFGMEDTVVDIHLAH